MENFLKYCHNNSANSVMKALILLLLMGHCDFIEAKSHISSYLHIETFVIVNIYINVDKFTCLGLGKLQICGPSFLKTFLLYY